MLSYETGGGNLYCLFISCYFYKDGVSDVLKDFFLKHQHIPQAGYRVIY